MVIKYYHKKQRKPSKRSTRKIFLKKHQYHRDRTENLSEEEKRKKVLYMRNYY